MYELGDLAEKAHRDAGAQAAATCDLLIAVGGADAGLIADGAREAGQPNESIHLVEDANRAAELLGRVMRPGDVVLVKGSRGVGLDRTVAALTGEGTA